MPTYNATIGGPVGISNLDHNNHFVARIPVVVADIIAGDTTLTANAKITAADIIQIWDIPAEVVFLPGAVLETVIVGDAGNTGNIGIAGGDEMFDGVALDAAIGTRQPNLVTDDWGSDNVNAVAFAATDTLDFTFVADATIGSYILYVPGYVLF
jgi:hypothetical protein